MSEKPSLFRRSAEIFKSRPGLFVATAAVPYITLHPAFFGALYLFVMPPGGPQRDLRSIWEAMMLSDKLEFLGLFFLWITVPYAVAGRGLCGAASDQIANRAASFGKAVRDMAVFVPSAFFLGAVASVVSFLGACFLVIPGVVAGAAFSLVVPVAAIEGVGPFAALRRGLSAVFRVFGRVLLLFFFYSFVVLASLVVQGIMIGASPHIAAIRLAILAICTCLPLVPLALLNICLTLLYLEARERASGTPAAASR